MAAATASDLNRLATSCLQSVSVNVAVQDEKFWLPWSLVRLYYSAFYGAHALVRLLGVGCCRLDGEHIAHVDALARATTGQPAPFRIEIGSYTCLIDSANGTLVWTKAAGRPHEALWSVFNDVLGRVSAQVIAGPLPSTEAQAAFAQIESFRRMGAAKQSVSWLSRTRNEIQYRLVHDVWHPTGLTRQKRALLVRLTSQWTADPMTIDLDGSSAYGPLGEFCAASAFVVAMCRTLVVRISERNLSGVRSFVDYGPLAYAHAAQLTV